MAKLGNFPLAPNLDKILKALENDKAVDMNTVNLELINLSEYIVRKGASEITEKEMNLIGSALNMIQTKFKHMFLVSHRLDEIWELLRPE